VGKGERGSGEGRERERQWGRERERQWGRERQREAVGKGERERQWGRLGFSTVSCVYQEWSTTQRTSSQLDTTVGSIGVNMGQHSCGTLSTP
jgi:hypothetical protein